MAVGTDETEQLASGQIVDLAHAGESQSLAFTADLGDSEETAKLIAGMANTGGGTILVGVEDSGRPIGLSDYAATAGDARRTSQDVTPAVKVEVEEAELEKQPIAVVKVEAAKEAIETPAGKLPIRNESGATKAVADEEQKVLAKEMLKTVRGARKEAKEAREEAKAARSFKAQLPGLMLSWFVGGMIGVGLSALLLPS
jgi:predicted HTH transcriptional regulator